MIEPTYWHWAGFSLFVVVMLVLDLCVFHRHSREATLRESAAWTVFWCTLALAFMGLIYFWARETDPAKAHIPAMEFLLGYIVEWALSMDNVFVFAVVFSFFRVPLKYQHRVLFWGILGAIVMRLSFILAGAAILQQFAWVMMIFGVLLLYTAYKLVVSHGVDVDPDKNILLRIARKLLPVATGSHGEKFFVLENGRRCITPLFLVLLVVESTDVMFAIDSVPAIFTITKVPFIIFTSNVFAILGLRALYFLLAGTMDLFRYLHYGLAGVLGFIGLKMIGDYMVPNSSRIAGHFGWNELSLQLEPYAEVDHIVPLWLSFVIIVSLLATSVILSLLVRERHAPVAADEP